MRKSESYEVRVVRTRQSVIAGELMVPAIQCADREEARGEFERWTSFPEGAIASVDMVRVTTEVVRRWRADEAPVAMPAVTVPEARTLYWMLQERLESMDQAEYESPQGQALVGIQSAIHAAAAAETGDVLWQNKL